MEAKTPPTNHTISESSSLEPQLSQTRIRKNSVNILDEVKLLEKRNEVEKRKNKSSNGGSFDAESNSFRDVLRKKQLEQHVGTHYKGLEGYN